MLYVTRPAYIKEGVAFSENLKIQPVSNAEFEIFLGEVYD